ncbi:hypothetical protein ACIPSA_35725 [Streptomyces sp. NPDC086549]|uniref:hypothetical protein n=1 Tax=Streptomyces sp. NPDC086549 TaxID=3365752 RepID=UPI00383078F3
MPTNRMDLPELIRQVAASLSDYGTKVLILDDITRLRMHGADDQDTLDLIRAFMSMHVTLVLVGVDTPGSGLLREDCGPGAVRGVNGWEPTHTERRFDLVELGRLRYDTAPQITAWTAPSTAPGWAGLGAARMGLVVLCIPDGRRDSPRMG